MITNPIIHDRHIVKNYFENMVFNNIHKNKFITPKDLTIVTCRNLGTMEDRIINSLSGYEHKSILECNLEYLGINDLVVLTDNRLPWRNTFKIEMIYFKSSFFESRTKPSSLKSFSSFIFYKTDFLTFIDLLELIEVLDRSEFFV